uniref:uncharacterized protein LOC129519821 n=1 Tax=Nyctereutes procyonoides TaxID=34880 RepID=UPI002443F9DD|nr:uncharacterized protein LOC129519821 [Nyctereutes procyonoides]
MGGPRAGAPSAPLQPPRPPATQAGKIGCDRPRKAGPPGPRQARSSSPSIWLLSAAGEGARGLPRLCTCPRPQATLRPALPPPVPAVTVLGPGTAPRVSSLQLASRRPGRERTPRGPDPVLAAAATPGPPRAQPLLRSPAFAGEYPPLTPVTPLRGPRETWPAARTPAPPRQPAGDGGGDGAAPLQPHTCARTRRPPCQLGTATVSPATVSPERPALPTGLSERCRHTGRCTPSPHPAQAQQSGANFGGCESASGRREVVAAPGDSSQPGLAPHEADPRRDLQCTPSAPLLRNTQARGRETQSWFPGTAQALQGGERWRVARHGVAARMPTVAMGPGRAR